MSPNEPKTKILLAEDTKSLQVAIQDFLEDEGFDVVAVANKRGVVEHGPACEVLVVDVRLPTREMEGISAVAELLEAGKIDQTVPIIFISVLDRGDPGCEGKLNQYPLMADRYIWLQKPFELEMLVWTIQDELQRRKNAG